MSPGNKKIHDYYILPYLEFGKENLKLYEKNQGILDSFRFDDLDQIFTMGINISLDEVA